MKRRDFLRSVGASAALPFLPNVVPASASAAPVLSSSQIGWATLCARANAQVSARNIQTWLSVGPEKAQALIAVLAKNNVIAVPVGASAAVVDPVVSNAFRGKAVSKSSHLAQAMRNFANNYPDHSENDCVSFSPTDQPSQVSEQYDETA